MTSILLVRTSAIGDVIQTLPVLDYLCQKFPDGKIDWVVEGGIAPLLSQIRLPGNKTPLSRVIPIRSKRWASSSLSRTTRQEIHEMNTCLRQQEYDVIFDLQGNTKSGCITLAAKGKRKVGFGWQSAREKTNLIATKERYDFPIEWNIRKKYLGLVQSFYGDETPFMGSGFEFALSSTEHQRLDALLSAPLMQSPVKLMIAMGSKWENKRLGQQALCDLLAKISIHHDPAFLLIYGSPEGKREAESLHALFPSRSMPVGELSLPLWQTLMWKVDGVIAVDSAALHLAGTTQTPTFSVFGPTVSSIFKPIGDAHIAVQGNCPYGKVFAKQCPILRTCPSGACIKQIDSDGLFAGYLDWLEARANNSSKSICCSTT